MPTMFSAYAFKVWRDRGLLPPLGLKGSMVMKVNGEEASGQIP